jgi:hypothetical protein
MSGDKPKSLSTKSDNHSLAGGSLIRIRSTLAHLHVAPGHVTNEKLQGMLHLNGAQSEIIEAVKHLKCQICSQVTSPMATPKAAFQRPMVFNERILSDTFYVWDTKNEKFAVTLVVPDCHGHEGSISREYNPTSSR